MIPVFNAICTFPVCTGYVVKSTNDYISHIPDHPEDTISTGMNT